MKENHFELSIITVPYKCKEVFREAMLSMVSSKTTFSFEIIIVDNDSKDGTVEMVESEFLQDPNWQDRITLIKNTNEGFPKANNRGLAVRRGRYVLFLNPDTKLSPDTLEHMMSFMKKRPDVGISTCKLIRKNGQLDFACKRSFPNPWVGFCRLFGLARLFPRSRLFAKYNLGFQSQDEETEMDACSGAFMFLSPDCIKTLKGFDESYYMYGEDLDLCMRAKLAGYKVWYWPKTQTIHYKGESSKKNPKVLFAFYHAMWIFYKQYYSKKYLHLLDIPVFIGIWTLYGVKLIIQYLKYFINHG